MTTRFLIYLTLLLLVCLLGLFQYKRLSRPYRLLTLFVLVTFLSELATRYFARVYVNSGPVYHLYLPVQYFFITAFYGNLLPRWKTALSWSWVVFVLLVLVNAMLYQSPLHFASNIILLSCPVYILCALLSFRNMLSLTDERPLLRQELFWYNTSTLFLYIFTFFCWSFYNILLKSGNTVSVATLTTVMYVLGLQYYIVTGIVIYLDARHSKKKDEQ